MKHWMQWYRPSRNIREATLKIVYFHYVKGRFLDQSTQKIIANLILKTEALIRSRSEFRRRMECWEALWYGTHSECSKLCVFQTRFHPNNVSFDVVRMVDVRSDTTDRSDVMMYLFTTVPHPHGHWRLKELLGNNLLNLYYEFYFSSCRQWVRFSRNVA